MATGLQLQFERRKGEDANKYQVKFIGGEEEKKQGYYYPAAKCAKS